jgi:YHS domain-containing protein
MLIELSELTKMVSGRYKQLNSRKEHFEMAIDPVCGMQVDEKSAAATYEYKGKTYYFCAPGCKSAFVKDPEMYLRQQEMHGAHQSHGGHHH